MNDTNSNFPTISGSAPCLGDQLVVLGTSYEIIGIDSYVLHNYVEQSRRWKSYTLQSAAHRHGLTSIGGRTVLWRPTVVTDRDWPAGLTLNPELSGTAAISIEGDPGPSTPLAQLLWFESADHTRLFAGERFLHLAGGDLHGVTDRFYTGEVIDD